MTQLHNVNSGNAGLLRLVTWASVAAALVLLGAKSWAYLATGSLAVLASLVDSLMDAAASTINLLAVRYSLKSADDDHKFGHGKAEYLAGLGQALFIAGSALFIVYRGIERLITPQQIVCTAVGVWVMVFAILVTIALLVFQHRVVKRTGCMAIKADSLHYATDLFTNLGTILALWFASLGHDGLDPYFAIAIALVIFYSAYTIGHESIQFLMDRQMDPESEAAVGRIALGHGSVLGVHDIRTRRSGQTTLIQLHLELEGGTTLVQSHQVAKEVERGIQEKFPDADIIIHQDPVVNEK